MPANYVCVVFRSDIGNAAVVNGQSNGMFLSIENKSDRNITLENVAGSFHHAETDKLLKNVSLSYCIVLLKH